MAVREFRRRHREEPAGRDAELEAPRARGRVGTLTLVYGARDTERNRAVVLAELLR